ncbi:threonylcarbamoyl-AMP synthase [Paucihalobacter ruber]|uniref:Threonylcarbamoyl-AMP synthase n=1 Tax=Paucihalobacter ruber TaxID=2567861 RepID=A0A506PRR3_9FLAO|nr:L-threonylcarbamoyladenylate synthase [Paucihalobacter ruber]TPV35885.1 threonylcarbamoyl-AMP synthase [Paucihalobacter ruber]
MSIISTNINKAVSLLLAEEIVAIPTETVYGLAGNIFSEKAIKAIFETKQRPFFNPLIVHISSVNQLPEIVSYIPEKAKLLAETFWPGPLTMVLPKKETIPDLITAGKNTVAVRIPNHPVTLELLSKLPFPLAAPSANPFTTISPTTAQHVETYFKNNIKMILDGGPCKQGIESTIVGFEGDKAVVYRLGSTSVEAIEKVIGKVSIKNKKEIAPDAPGMLERHYAPQTKTILTDNIIEAVKNNRGKRIGLISFSKHFEIREITFQIALSPSGNLEEAASNLYKIMHELDQMNLDLIIAEQFPDYGMGKSINDRLTRAAKNN